MNNPHSSYNTERSIQALLESAEERRFEMERAVELRTQAARIEEGVNATYASQWRTVYKGYKELAGVPVGGKPFLLNVINYCSLEVPFSYTSQKPYDKKAVVDLFDSLKPGEPIVTDLSFGVVDSKPRSVVKDFLSGIGVDLLVDVVPLGADGVGDEAFEVLIDPATNSTFVGQTAIMGWVSSLKYFRTSDRCGHNFMFNSNIDQLTRAKLIVKAFNGVLDVQLDGDTLNQEIRKEQSARLTNESSANLAYAARNRRR